MSCTIVMSTIQLVNQHIDHFFSLSIRLSVCLNLFIVKWWESKRERKHVLEVLHTSYVITFYQSMNVISFCLSVCLPAYLKSVHVKQVHTIYIYANMIKGYITGRNSVIMWTNHFVHNKDTHTHENMISNSDRSCVCMIQTDS